jgi:small subunit ribosomal protein S17e
VKAYLDNPSRQKMEHSMFLGGTSHLGNVRTEQVKRTAKELIRRFPDKFSGDFEHNKHLVSVLAKGATRKIRNQIAGYIARTLAAEEPELEQPDDTLEEAEEGEETSTEQAAS